MGAFSKQFYTYLPTYLLMIHLVPTYSIFHPFTHPYIYPSIQLSIHLSISYKIQAFSQYVNPTNLQLSRVS